MEKKKNNAVEKAEKAQKTKKQQPKKQESNQNQKKNMKENSGSAPQDKKQQRKMLKEKNRAEKAKLKEQKAKQKAQMREQKKLKKEQARAERQKALAQKRIELAKIKAHKKEEKQRAKASILREKNRKRELRKQEKLRLKEERLKRKEMLKSESKKERHARIMQEKQAKRAEREQKRQAKLEKRKAKWQEKQERRKQRQARRDKNKGFGGWLAAVISLGVATLVLASVLTFTLLMPTTSDNMMELSYQKSFYDTVEQVDNIDLNLSKVLASKDAGAIEKYLIDTAINSELAENDINQLPLHDEAKFYTTKLINQIGDFSKYLVKKIIDGKPLSNVDKQNLENLYSANLDLKNALQEMMLVTGDDYSFASLEKARSNDALIKGFTKLQNLSVEYPELIYDGPFSDGQEQRVIKGLSKNEVTFEEAKENFLKIFKGYDFDSVESAGMADGDIVCYNVQATLGDSLLFAQMSKRDGKLIMFSYAGSCDSVIVDEDTAIENAEQFLANMGLTDMQEVWMNIANNVYTFNFAKTQNGVVLYPDIVKVRVCAETGKVIGIEAKSYFANHTNRNIGTPAISKSNARQSVLEDMQIKASRLALVPVGNTGEKLCYEFYGELNGQTYYVYIDATNGWQVEMFKVVSGTEGTYLM